MAHREKASMLPEWFSGLSPLLTTAAIYLKDPNHITQKCFSTLKSPCACCSQPNSNTRTIPRHQPSPSLLYFLLKETSGKSRTSYRVFQNKHLVWEPLKLNYKACWTCTVDTTQVAEGCAENLLYYKNKHNLKKNPFPVDSTEYWVCIARTSPVEVNLFVCNLPFWIFQ